MNRLDCDVLVVGGGVSGTAAAVASARSGAVTTLVEKETYLGGTGYAGKFQYICGLYLNAETGHRDTLNSGFARELAGLVRQAKPGSSITKIGQVYVLPYSSEELQQVLSSLCTAEKKLTVFRGSHATTAETQGGKIGAVTVEQSVEKTIMAPKTVIDCTGNGNIAALAGAEFELTAPEQRQLAGFTLRLTGLEQAEGALAIKVPYHLAKAVEQGIFLHSVKYTLFSPGASADEGDLKMSIEGEDGSEREKKARKDADAVVSYLASVLPAFKNARIADTSLKVLDREGRRIRGEYMLTREDVLSARKFPDGVVKNAWPIELWDRLKGTVYKYVPRGDYYEIPFRCLTVRGISNLLTAGRCISVDHDALGSTRVMGPCMALGEQAGLAAAYHAKNGSYPVYDK